MDVNIHTGSVEWWQSVAGMAPLAALAAASIAAWIAWGSLRQKTGSDNRAEWWRRAEWAFDSILSQEPRRAQVGLQVMTVLAESTPSREEVEFITVAWSYPLEEAAESTKMDGLSPPEVPPSYPDPDLDVELDPNPKTGNNEPTASDTR